jgi:hypothetical protein
MPCSIEQPELVYRMSFVHAVTVMEAYLMYCAGLCWNMTGLLNAGCILPEVRTRQKNEKQSVREMELDMFRPSAQLCFPNDVS